jgi:hypothetical protein
MIFGTATDGELDDRVRVTIIATGFENNEKLIENSVGTDEVNISQTQLFEKNKVEFIKRDDKDPVEEVIHNIEDNYQESEDSLDSKIQEPEDLEKTDEVVIEELDSADPFEFEDSSNKKNEYISKRKKRVNNHNNHNYSDESLEQKLAIPAYKRKNISLDDESGSEESKTLDFTEED